MTRLQERPEHADVALRGLVDRGVLTAAQVAEVRATLSRADAEHGPTRWWAELAGYIGGVLMLGGGALLLATEWQRLTEALRVAILVLVALALIAAGLIIGRGPHQVRGLQKSGSPTRRRVVGVLFALSSVAAAAAAAVLGDQHAGIAAGAAGLIVAGGGYALLRTTPGLLASAVASVVLVGSAMEELNTTTPFAVGLAYLGLGSVWVILAAVGVVLPRPVGLAVGAVLALVGAQQPLGAPDTRAWAYALTLAVAFGCFILYRWQREIVMLVAGVVGVATVAPEAVWDWTDGAAGGAAILLFTGGSLVAASSIGFGVWRVRIGRPRRPAK